MIRRVSWSPTAFGALAWLGLLTECGGGTDAGRNGAQANTPGASASSQSGTGATGASASGRNDKMTGGSSGIGTQSDSSTTGANPRPSDDGGGSTVPEDAGAASGLDGDGANGGPAASAGGSNGGPTPGDAAPASDTGDSGPTATSSHPLASGGRPPRPYTNKAATCGGSATWGNAGNQGMPDPTMTKQGSKYYAFGTGGGYVTSTDRVTWSRGGSVFPNGLPAWTHYLAAPALWAPDVHLVNGTYYCYYAISTWGNYNSSVGLATSPNLDGPWTDQGVVVDYKTGGAGVNVIDPDLFVDDNGTWWLIYGSYKSGLRLIPLDPTSGKARSGTPSPTVITTSLGEGSDIIQHNGFYYVFASRGKCCAGLQSTYQIAMGRAKTVTGPYLGSNGVSWATAPYTIFLTGDATHPGVGGQSFFRDDDDQLYMVYGPDRERDPQHSTDVVRRERLADARSVQGRDVLTQSAEISGITASLLAGRSASFSFSGSGSQELFGPGVAQRPAPPPPSRTALRCQVKKSSD